MTNQLVISEGRHRRKRRKTPEQDLHKAVAQYLSKALRPPTIWTTIGHGGGGRVRGAILKGLGMKKGWPDIIVMAPGEGRQSLVVGIELKSAKGDASDEQRDVQSAFNQAGALYVVCRSIDGVATALRWAGIPVHAHVMGKAA